MKVHFLVFLLCYGWIAAAGQQTGDNSISKQAATSSLWEILSEEAVANQAALIASDEKVSAWSISDWERYSQERASKLRRRSSEAHSFEQKRLLDADVKSDPMKAFTLKWEAEKMFWKDYPPYPTMLDICAITKLSEDSAKQPSMLELAAALAEADRVAFGATSAKEVLTARRILRITLAAVLDHKTYLEEEPEKNQKSNGSLSETTSTNRVDELNQNPDALGTTRPLHSTHIDNKDGLNVEANKTEQQSSIIRKALILALLLIMATAGGVFIIRRR